MSFPRLTFPLTADFGSDGYWINDDGPFQVWHRCDGVFLRE